MLIAAEQAAEHAAQHSESFFGSPETWVALAFIVVVGGAAKPVFKALTAGLDARAAKILGRLQEAAQLKTESQALLAEYQRKQAEALKDAEDIIAHAKAEAQRLAEQASKDLGESLKRREQQALDRIAQAEASAVKEVRDRSIDLAIAAAESLLVQQVQGIEASNLVQQAIQDLPNKLH